MTLTLNDILLIYQKVTIKLKSLTQQFFCRIQYLGKFIFDALTAYIAWSN